MMFLKKDKEFWEDRVSVQLINTRMDDIKDILATVRDDVEIVRKAGTWN
jgi:hypothetical protein